MEDNSLCAPPLNAHARKPGVVVCMRNKSETQEELQWIAAHTPLLSLTIPGHSKVVYNRFIISSSQTPMDLPFQSRSAIQPYLPRHWMDHAHKPGVVVCMRNKSETQEELQWIAAHTPLLSLTIPGHSKVVYNRFIISSSQTPMDLTFQSRSATWINAQA